MTTKSALFVTYNHMRGHEEAGRLNRALGIAQSAGGNAAHGYVTTATTCTCADWRYRIGRTGGRCKHIMAYVMASEADALTGRKSIDLLR